MRKNILIAILLLGLVAALSAPAAAKKKKKKVKPYKSETVTIAVGHPVFNGATGSVVSVTGQEFLQTCSIPSSNGFDAYVFAVPKPYQKLIASVEAIGESPTPVPYDLDIYMYDKKCNQVGASNAVSTDESGVMGKGTAYLLVHPYTGAPVDTFITLKAMK